MVQPSGTRAISCEQHGPLPTRTLVLATIHDWRPSTDTPTTVVSSAVTFTVWANNSAGSNSTTISITVQEEAADISYAGSPFTFTKNSLVSGATATNVGGAPDAWAIDPEISTSIPGLSFNTATGAITGTPTGVHSAAMFTVWANNSAE